VRDNRDAATGYGDDTVGYAHRAGAEQVGEVTG
jgi:hypothetical protein